jgi:hypothetical protein
MRCAQLLTAGSVIVALAPAPACSGKDPYNPGTPIGVFHVTGALVGNACAAADQVPNPWEFDVKLSRDGSTLYWIQGGLPVQGHLDAASHTTMASQTSQQLRAPNPKSGASGCTLTRDDALDATLGSEPVTSFSGALTYTFRATSDSDCSDQLAVNGGGFTNLPCEVSYTLSAAKTTSTLR